MTIQGDAWVRKGDACIFTNHRENTCVPFRARAEQNLTRLWTEQGDKLCAQFGMDSKVVAFLAKVAEAGQTPT